MVEQGWGRIVNVTTKLDTMSRPYTSPCGASKAAIEMATEVWAKEVEGTGLTINIVNPAPAPTFPAWPLLYFVSREADNVNAWRFDANLWTPHCPRPKPRRAGFELHPQPG